MGKILTSVVLMLLASVTVSGQDISNCSLDAINSQVAAKARLFCKYVVAVGSSAGQEGDAGEAQKGDIIRNRVPRLFWDYPKRVMVTTNGRNGKIIKRRSMSGYFASLRAQARGGSFTSRSYELHYVGIKPQAGGKGSGAFRLKETTGDGCKVYVSTIVVEQIYHYITWRPEGTSVLEEKDVKELEVSVLAKPNGKAEIYLGDVTRAYRIK